MSGEDVSNPGRLELDGIDDGLPDHQEWNVMLLTDDTMVVYYCGNILDQWHFEGLLVMSRTYELNPERETDVKRILDELEISESEICSLDPADAC